MAFKRLAVGVGWGWLGLVGAGWVGWGGLLGFYWVGFRFRGSLEMCAAAAGLYIVFLAIRVRGWYNGGALCAL